MAMVEPIREEKSILAIKGLLSDRPRDLLLFTLGVNNGLRISDLLAVKVGQVRDLKPGEMLYVKEKKTGKRNVLMINKATHKVLHRYLSETKLADDDYLFKSRQGSNRPLSPSMVHRMIKDWCDAVGLVGNFSTNTLRKTFGYIQRVKFGVSFEVLAKRYNHSSPAITQVYLGITSKEVNDILLNEI